MAAVAQQCPGAAGQLTGSLVQLQRLFHGGLAGMYLLLGRCLGVGGFADVYEASLVPSNDIFTSSSNGHAHTVATVAAAAAAAAGPAGRSSGAVTFAVKVYHSSKPGVADSYLQHLAAQELHALELLRGFNTAVQLMAEGELVTSPTYSTHSETGNAVADVSKCSGAPPAGCVIDVSGSSSSKLGSARLPRCAVLELAQFSLHEVVQRLVRCSEVYASAVAHEVLSLLEIAQSGAHGYMITHRDLKPANILVRANGSIAVADFGACHITKATAAAAAAAAGAGMQTRIGTVFYAAPELRHEPEQSSDSSGGGYDGSVDVFAVGVIVVEMLAGRLDGLCNADEVSRGQLAARLHWEQQLQRVVDGELLLPGEVSLSAAALQFIGCCCGVAREREAAAAAGQRKRLTPLQLLALPWVL
jgi:serine/threonine protein kinase